MKTFVEEVRPDSESAKKIKHAFPTFEESTAAEAKKCMSEKMVKQCESMCKEMCEEMKACHENESAHTAESYKSECNERLTEMMKVVEKMCNEYMQ